MAKKKKAMAGPVEVRPRPTVRLYGKDVIKNGKVDQKVKLRLAGKITETGRERYDQNRLYQEIEITSVKKMLTGADLEDAVSRKANA